MTLPVGTAGRGGSPNVRRPRVVHHHAHPVGVFGGLFPATRPITRAQHHAHRQTARAQTRLPARPVPSIPALAHPTRQQVSAAQHLIHRSVHRQAGGRHRTGASVANVNAELLQDPRTRRLIQAAMFTAGYLTPAQRSLFLRQRQDVVRPIGTSQIHQHRIGIPGIGSITVNPHMALSHLLDVGNLRSAVAEAGQVGTGIGKFVHPVTSDLATLGTAPFVGGYQAIRGVADAASGHGTKRLHDLGAGIVHGVETSAPAALLTGHPGLAAERFARHPIIEALNFAGGEAAVGRGLGAAARGLGSTVAEDGVRGALARVGSTSRPDLALTDTPGSRLVHQRKPYSKDLFRKGVQVAADRRRGEAGFTTEKAGRQVPVLRSGTVEFPIRSERQRLMDRKTDYIASRANSVNRTVRERTAHEIARLAPTRLRHRIDREIVPFALEGTARTAKTAVRDLKAHRDRIAAQIDQAEAEIKHAPPGTPKQTIYRMRSEIAAAKERVATIDRFLKSKPTAARLDAIFRARGEIGAKLNAADLQMGQAGLGNLHRLRRSRLFPYAQEHMGARHTEALNPAHVAARTTAEQAVATALEREKAIAADLEQLRHRRSRIVGQQAVRRGQAEAQAPQRSYYVGTQRFEDRAAAEAYRKANGGTVRVLARNRSEADRMGQIAQIERRIAARAKELRDAQKVRRGAQDTLRRTPKPEPVAALRHPDGRFMSNSEIEAHMRSAGIDPNHIGYLPHRLDVRGARAFYSQFRGGNRPTVANEARTGRLYERGATATTFRTIQEHAVRQATQVAKAGQVDRFVKEAGLKHPDGRYFTAKEAKDLAQRLESDTGEAWTPISAVPAKLERDLQDQIRSSQDPQRIEELSQQLINSRLDAARSGAAKNNVLVPTRMLKRLQEHVAPAGGTERVMQFINRPFRFAVLAQPRWLTGQFVEPYVVRLPTVGSGIFLPGLAADLRAASKVTKLLPPGVRDEVRAELEGGLMIGNRGLSNYRTLNDLPGVVRYGKVLAQLPVARQMAWFAKHATTMTGRGFFAANRIIERQAQKAALGHLVRKEIQEFTGSWTQTLRLSGKAAQEMADGLVNTATQQRLAAGIDELLGKYSRWSPTTRRMIQTFAPFVPWSLAAARFVFWTLPAHNSVKTAVLVQASKVNSKAWRDAHKDVPPGELQVGIPSHGGFVDAARYTPFGFTAPLAGGDYSGISDTVLPQASGVLKALGGKDPFGNDLRVSPTSGDGTGKPTAGQDRAIAAKQAYESFLPLVSVVRRIREGGATGYADSTIFSPKTKPGTKHMSGVRRALDPTAPIYLRSGGSSGPDLRNLSPIQRDRVRRAVSGGLSPALSAIQRDRLARATGR